MPLDFTCVPSPRFRSFLWGGVEGADHINGEGASLDMQRSSGHVDRLELDFAAFARLGITTVRESIGWRLCEDGTATGNPIDLSRVIAIAESAERHGVQVLWTLMHYGTPAGVGMLDDAFIERFTRFAITVASALKPYGIRAGEAPVYTPINEINFLSWAVAETRLMGAHEMKVSGYEVKRQLVKATLAAMRAMRVVDSRARFLHIEPVVHVVAPRASPDLAEAAIRERAFQWQAADMLLGRLDPELGGHEGALDLLGLNHYNDSQWEVPIGARLQWFPRDARRAPLSRLLREAFERYGRPLVISETGHIGSGRAAWLNDVAMEVGRARSQGIPVDGLCLYPLLDRHDWNDADHWHHSGLWDSTPDTPRRLDFGYARALRRWQRRLPGNQIFNKLSGTTMPYLIVFSHLRWGFVYQRPQHLLSRLASTYRVVFIEEPLFDEGEPRFDRSSGGDNVEVLCPRTAVHANGFHDDQLSVLKPLLDAYLQEHSIDDYAVWFYTPMALPLMADMHPRAIIYDCMDELSAFKGAPPQMRQRESALLKLSNVVLAGGPALYEGKRNRHANVHCIPSGVDAAHYSPANLPASFDSERSDDVRPRLGFFGVIDERLDLDLVAFIADSRPDWQIVMVGPVVKIDPARLPQRSNIEWLGMQDYQRLPSLVAQWDVCLMPFALNESTRFISPTKTLEYMAAEKPVVSTAVPDVIGLYGSVVRVAMAHQQFVDQCEAAMRETPTQAEQRIASMLDCVARASWQSSAKFVLELIEHQLAANPLRSQTAESQSVRTPKIMATAHNDVAANDALGTAAG